MQQEKSPGEYAACDAGNSPSLIEQRRLSEGTTVRPHMALQQQQIQQATQQRPRQHPQQPSQQQAHQQPQRQQPPPPPPPRHVQPVSPTIRRPLAGPVGGRPPPPGLVLRSPPAPPLRAFETPLDSRFSLVEKPKRFFTVGRIFKTAWFEPGGTDLASTVGLATAGQQCRQAVDYARACPAFHSEKPHAKFRWFVVVRRRLHHSLCFAITTSMGRAAANDAASTPGAPRAAGRGRPRDFVVLYPAPPPMQPGDEGPTGPLRGPPEPLEGEGIDREPLEVIIEDGAQAISELARLDCGRIYTVEDNVKVMKIGRIHADGLKLLEQYFRESVS